MRRIIVAFFCVLVLFAHPIYASAHPGGTDGKGGHYNRSTGEYHYHHGYGEHQHKDIDGDGNLDCPYDFTDNTEHHVLSRTESIPRKSITIISNVFKVLAGLMLSLFVFSTPIGILSERAAEQMVSLAFKIAAVLVFMVVLAGIFLLLIFLYSYIISQIK